MTEIDPERLRLVMELRGVSNEELATRVVALGYAAGCTSEYIAMMRSGKRRAPRNPVLRKYIADALGVPTDWIEKKENDR